MSMFLPETAFYFCESCLGWPLNMLASELTELPNYPVIEVLCTGK